jgi:hypothetical protein
VAAFIVRAVNQCAPNANLAHFAKGDFLGRVMAWRAPSAATNRLAAQSEDVTALSAGIGAARLAIPRRLKLPDGCNPGLPEGPQRHERDAAATIALGFQQIVPAVDRLADRRLGLRSPGEGIACPPAHMIAFHASRSRRLASRIFACAAFLIRIDSR